LDTAAVWPSRLASRSAVYSPRGTIATSQPLASAAGLEMLQRGGTAADAAVAAAAVLNLVEPHMTGLGGDLFVLYWSALEQRLLGLNASGRSGSLMTREDLVRRGHRSVPASGAESINVPGALRGWADLLDRHGRFSLGEVLQPAIRLAREGFPVSPIIAGQWAAQLPLLGGNAAAADTYLLDGERTPRAGEWFTNHDFARSLSLIAKEGPNAFYDGELGRRIVDEVRRLGGFLTLADLREHRSEWVEPIGVPFRGHRLWQLPPPGQGIAALQMLRLLDGFDLAAMGHNSAEYLHHLIEAKKLAYADLAGHIADPGFMRVRLEDLLSDSYVEARRRLIVPARAAEHVQPGEAFTASETIYLAAADAEGNMISFVNSLFGHFGSGVVVPGTGFMLQNRASGFSFEEGHANEVGPGKRPFHTLIAGFVTRLAEGTPSPASIRSLVPGEQPWLAFGVMGGPMQPQGQIQVLLNMLLFDMDPQQAVEAARFRHFSGLSVGLEPPIPDAVRGPLRARGHQVSDTGETGGAQAVVRLPRGWVAGSDPRKDGQAVGN
jgi:gamma-glutamyltranspeptidase/glutathione hydrolase